MKVILAVITLSIYISCVIPMSSKGFPTISRTSAPTRSPISLPTSVPSSIPTISPSEHPTFSPTEYPTPNPTLFPSARPSYAPSNTPTTSPTLPIPTNIPTNSPRSLPTFNPSIRITTTSAPSIYPSAVPTPCPSTRNPTELPTTSPSESPTPSPSTIPTLMPSILPSQRPSWNPSASPSQLPTANPSTVPSNMPSFHPSGMPTYSPSAYPTFLPSALPSGAPTWMPSGIPTTIPSSIPSVMPSSNPSAIPSESPTIYPTSQPTFQPTGIPTSCPSISPTDTPSNNPTGMPSNQPTVPPTHIPSSIPSQNPSSCPSFMPTESPTISLQPSSNPSFQPTVRPTSMPTSLPTRVLETVIQLTFSQTLVNVSQSDFQDSQTAEDNFIRVIEANSGVNRTDITLSSVSSRTLTSNSLSTLEKIISFVPKSLKKILSLKSNHPLIIVQSIESAIDLRYLITAIAQEYGFESGELAASTIIRRIENTSSDAFISALRSTGDVTFQYATSTSVRLVNSSIIYVHSASPTRQPTSPTFYAELPLYAKVLFPIACIIGGVIFIGFIIITKCFMDISALQRKKGADDRYQSSVQGSPDNFQHRMPDSPDRLTIEMNPYYSSNRKSGLRGSPGQNPETQAAAALGSETKSGNYTAQFKNDFEFKQSNNYLSINDWKFSNSFYRSNPLTSDKKSKQKKSNQKTPYILQKNPSNITNKAFYNELSLTA